MCPHNGFKIIVPMHLAETLDDFEKMTSLMEVVFYSLVTFLQSLKYCAIVSLLRSCVLVFLPRHEAGFTYKDQALSVGQSFVQL